MNKGSSFRSWTARDDTKMPQKLMTVSCTLMSHFSEWISHSQTAEDSRIQWELPKEWIWRNSCCCFCLFLSTPLHVRLWSSEGDYNDIINMEKYAFVEWVIRHLNPYVGSCCLSWPQRGRIYWICDSCLFPIQKRKSFNVIVLMLIPEEREA